MLTMNGRVILGRVTMKFDHKPDINALSIKLHGSQIGIINRLAGDRHIFSFEEAYLENPFRPTLSLSFKGQGNELVSSTRAFNLRLPPYFSNVLPEGHLRTYLAQRAKVKPEREFYLLAALGEDLPGALTATPFVVDEPLIQHAMDEGDFLNDTALHFSLAGIQLKFSAIMEASGGLTIPANGMGGSWIIKLPSARFQSVTENEFVMLALAREVGIRLPANRLINLDEIRGLPEEAARLTGKALAVQRFDRAMDGTRIHMEDFAQVFGLYPDDKYQKRSYANIAAVLWAESGEADVHEFFRRLVFSVLIGNADMHLKNWSLLYPDGRAPVLSPAYDLISTVPYIQNDELALRFGGSKNLNEISPEQIRHFSDSAGIPTSPLAALVLETVEKTESAWRGLAEKALLPRLLREAIDHQIDASAKNTLQLWRK